MSVPVEEKLLQLNIRLLVRLWVLSSALQSEVVPPPPAPAAAPSAPPPSSCSFSSCSCCCYFSSSSSSCCCYFLCLFIEIVQQQTPEQKPNPEDTNPPIRGSGLPIDGRSHTGNNNNVSQVQMIDHSGQLASYLSALSAVSVNTDTPTEVSWMTGMSLHAASPNTHSSEK